MNKLAVVAIIMAVVAAAGISFLGIGGLAVFAVGAGHVSRNQIRLRGDRGRWLATAALAIGYAIATLALYSSLRYAFALVLE
ncbi:hypothetical protein [Arthrobacter sp. PAMC 25486]|uniref:hypothetical protein n=1 Tax=Arthrobacter sp. PAMC 25486 TaxID=1494608 RepID=UPI000570FA31|nr:hypothetical protein [Arthrobacter sp. PAMC 25486]